MQAIKYIISFLFFFFTYTLYAQNDCADKQIAFGVYEKSLSRYFNFIEEVKKANQNIPKLISEKVGTNEKSIFYDNTVKIDGENLNTILMNHRTTKKGKAASYTDIAIEAIEKRSNESIVIQVHFQSTNEYIGTLKKDPVARRATIHINTMNKSTQIQDISLGSNAPNRLKPCSPEQLRNAYKPRSQFEGKVTDKLPEKVPAPDVSGQFRGKVSTTPNKVAATSISGQFRGKVTTPSVPSNNEDKTNPQKTIVSNISDNKEEGGTSASTKRLPAKPVKPGNSNSQIEIKGNNCCNLAEQRRLDLNKANDKIRHLKGNNCCNLAEQRRLDLNKAKDTITHLNGRVSGLVEERNRDAKTITAWRDSFFSMKTEKENYATKYTTEVQEHRKTEDSLFARTQERNDLATKSKTLNDENKRQKDVIRQQNRALDSLRTSDNYWKGFFKRNYSNQNTIYLCLEQTIPLQNNAENTNTNRISQMGISIYGAPYWKISKWQYKDRWTGIYLAGFSFSNLVQQKFELPPTYLREVTLEGVNKVQKTLRDSNIAFTALNNTGYVEAYDRFNVDLNFHLKKTPLYLKLGANVNISKSWYEYDGNLLGRLPSMPDGRTYIVDYKTIVNGKLRVGIAWVQRFVHGSIVYDMSRPKNDPLQLNLGLNLPINTDWNIWSIFERKPKTEIEKEKIGKKLKRRDQKVKDFYQEDNTQKATPQGN